MAAQAERFHNLDSFDERRGSFADIWRFVFLEQRRQRQIERQLPPPAPTPRVANDGVALRANTTRTSITWVGHSSFLLQMGGHSILTDPIWSNKAGAGPFGPARIAPPGLRM